MAYLHTILAYPSKPRLKGALNRIYGAIKAAYPKADDAILNAYKNDSICGTWEMLANAIYHVGEKALSAKGWQAVGAEKTRWAENITPHMIPKVANRRVLFFSAIRHVPWRRKPATRKLSLIWFFFWFCGGFDSLLNCAIFRQD
jgi:hypothetical protein